VTLTTHSLTLPHYATEEEQDSARKPGDEIPQKSRITMQDILGIDLGFIDPRILPKRPYLTVCKVCINVYSVELVCVYGCIIVC